MLKKKKEKKKKKKKNFNLYLIFNWFACFSPLNYDVHAPALKL